MISKEIRIDVPWGHIAGKAWGDEKDTPILVFHGILDNAGTFDRLILQLPNSFYYICLDLPGHGRSSHLPPFFPYISINMILAYKLIMRHFKQKSYTILGHSYGGQLAFLYAQLYPDEVNKIIMLECVHLPPTSSDYYIESVRRRLDHTLGLYFKKSKTGPPRHTYEEALSKVIQGRFWFLGNTIDVEAAKTLLPRALIKVGDDKYIFSLDQRVKSFLSPLHDYYYILETVKENPIQCPILIVLGAKEVIHQFFWNELLQLLSGNRLVTITQVDGHHDVHNEKPELVAPIVSNFLLLQKHKL